MRRLLWVGDAVASTGFARCTHAACDVLAETWDVRVLGINYDGDPPRREYPYPLYPAGRAFRREDPFGVSRLSSLVEALKPDAIVLLNDPWNIPAYAKEIDGRAPIVGWIAVDGKNCRGDELNDLDLAIFWTRFAEQEARDGGYGTLVTADGSKYYRKSSTAVVGLGVDVELFRPRDRRESREALRIPAEIHDGFIVGNINRNQPRKHLGLTVAYFAEWIQLHDIEDAYLYLHVAPTGEQSCDIRQLVKYYGIEGRVLKVEPDIGYGINEKFLATTYSAFDVMLTTTQGEGFGLTTIEGMASGVPQIVPDWSALGEWTEDAVLKVPCSTITHTPNGINSIGGIMDRAEAIAALDLLYRESSLRRELSQKGLDLVSRPQFRWRAVGEAFRDTLETISLGAENVRHEPTATEETTNRESYG